MSAPARFKQADVTKAMKGVAAAGFKPSGCKIDPATGAIIVMLGGASAKPATGNPWDEELAG